METDKWVLEKTLGDPSQMVHLNGPENEGKLKWRHEKFLKMSQDPRAGCMFTITTGDDAAPVGNAGYWETEWQGQEGWETGWFVLSEFQSRGIATASMRLLIDHVTSSHE